MVSSRWLIFVSLKILQSGHTEIESRESHQEHKGNKFLYILSIYLVRSLVAYSTTSKYAKDVIKWRATQNICLQKHSNL